MRRREFLAVSAAAVASRWAPAAPPEHHQHGTGNTPDVCGLTYPTPAAAIAAPPETLAYMPALYTGTKTNRPDYLATVDVDPDSETYSQVIHRSVMPAAGDELHHFGWNACSSCHDDPNHCRRYLIVPGLTSGNIHIIDTADPARTKRIKTVPGQKIADETNLSAPHTVHCLADGTIMISMLGDAQGEGPGGFLLLDQDFEILGR